MPLVCSTFIEFARTHRPNVSCAQPNLHRVGIDPRGRSHFPARQQPKPVVEAIEAVGKALRPAPYQLLVDQPHAVG
jgi:hypothetical protein